MGWSVSPAQSPIPTTGYSAICISACTRQNAGAPAARFAITRCGVMQYLRVLEEAHLAVAGRRGRDSLPFPQSGAAFADG